MSSTKYNTIMQHQQLRVPDKFGQQERQLVIQIDEIFDDIYKRFGRLGMNDMSEGFQFIVNNKYDRISGITIDEDGVEVSGSKYVKINSGGTFEVDSTNFQISSLTKDIVMGGTKLSQLGLTFTNSDGTTVTFWRPLISLEKTDVAGVRIDYEWSGGGPVQYGTELISRKGIPHDLEYSNSDLGSVCFTYLTNPYGTEPLSAFSFYPSNFASASNILGRSLYPWHQGYIDTIYTKDIKAGYISIHDDPDVPSIDLYSGYNYIHFSLFMDHINYKHGLVSSGYQTSGSGFGYVTDEKEIIVRGPDGVIRLTGNLTGDVTGNVTGNLNGNVVKSTGTFDIYPSGTTNEKLTVTRSIVNGHSYIDLSSNADYLTFSGNADSATKLSRAPTYGELSGR